MDVDDRVAGDGVFQLFDSLEIVGIDVSLIKFQKKCKELKSGDSGTRSAGLLADMGVDRNDSSTIAR